MLTVSQIEKMKPHRHRYTVTDGKGLGIEVMPSGLKVWRYRLGAQRVTVGRYPKTSIKKARAWHSKWDPVFREQGIIPQLIEGPGSAQTVKDFSERYIREVVEKERKNPKQIVAMLRNQVWPKLGRRRMTQVAGGEVRDLIFAKRDMGRPAAAAALRNLIKRLWDYAIVCGVAQNNPAGATPLKFIQRTAKTRERTLSRREVAKFMNTLASGEISWRHVQALLLILLTMCRKSELLAATWAEVDLDKGIWEIPAEHSKTGKPHIVYLSQQAKEVLWSLWPLNAERPNSTHAHPGTRRLDPSEHIFPCQDSMTQPMSPTTLNRAMARVKWGMPHFTIHDLRRTGATLLSEEGFPSDVIEKALNHTIKGVRGVYNRAEYSEQRKQMLQAWADLIDKWRTEYA